MQAKEYLERVSDAELELRILARKRGHLMDLMLSMGGMASAVWAQHNGSSRVEMAAVGLTDLSTQLDAAASQYTEIIRDAEEKFKQLPNRFREVLTYRYLCAMKWPEISAAMGYKDEKSVFRVHGYALRELQKTL